MNRREIKFRVFYKPKNFIYDVRKIDFEGLNNQIREVWFGNHWVRSNKLDDIILMQYTGLKDKNGVEIYEGDIVRWDDGSDGEKWRVAVVEINPTIQFRIIKINCDFKQSAENGYVFEFGKFIYKDTENHLEIIGNIYENKELLNEK